MTDARINKGGRPRKDGLPAGSPEARAVDAAGGRVSAPAANVPTFDAAPSFPAPGPAPKVANAGSLLPPELPPRVSKTVAGEPALPPGVTPPKVLPTDQSARAAMLATFRQDAIQIVSMVDGFAGRYLPPPMTDAEQAMVVAPLSELLWKHDGHLPCEIALLAALAMIYGPRYTTARAKAIEERRKSLGASDQGKKDA